MATLLHLDSSANPAESVTRELTALFARAWQATHAVTGYLYRDLAAEPVPPLDAAFCQLGRRVERHGLVELGKVAALAQDPAEQRAWALALPLIRQVRAAGAVLIGAPMYNLSVPATLTACLDRVTFPGAYTDPGTGSSVLHETQVVIVTARGGARGPGALGEGMDFQVPYLRAYFRKQGVAEAGIHVVSAEMTLAAVVPGRASHRPEAERSLARARAAVTGLATAIHRPAGQRSGA